MFFQTKKTTASQTTTTRFVTSQRWVNSSQLEIGMYVNELDKPWEATRFMFQGFVIDSYDTLRAVQESCEYANVQTEKMAMVSSGSGNRLVAATR